MAPPWTPSDPLLRRLRAVAVIAFLGFLGIIVADPGRRDPTLSLLLVGSILLALGFPVALRIPGWIGRPQDTDDDE